MISSHSDSIVAISTGTGNSPVALIRISGLRLLENPLPFLQSYDKKPISKERHGQVFLCRFIDSLKINSTTNKSNKEKVLDTVLLSVFAAPHSYTGEDVLEISFHGNQILLAEALDIIQSYGIRPALPGEFTKRAYLHGKLDLTQAEAVQEIISAENKYSLEKSRENLYGFISKETSRLRSFILNLRADLEAELDFADDELQLETEKSIFKQAENINNILQGLLEQGEIGRNNSRGIWAVITGKPNVGKSTFLNLLLGWDRAIVRPEPGTTRDYLHERIQLANQTIHLYDTAGIRSENLSSDVEKEGIKQALSLKKKANLIIQIIDLSMKNEYETYLKNKQDISKDSGNNVITLTLFNKLDIADKFFLSRQKEDKIESTKLTSEDNAHFSIYLTLKEEKSAREAILNALKEILNKKFNASGGIILSERIRYILQRAGEDMNLFLQSLQNREPTEISCSVLNNVMKMIEEITGHFDTEDVLGRVFSRFCIGK